MVPEADLFELSPHPAIKIPNVKEKIERIFMGLEYSLSPSESKPKCMRLQDDGNVTRGRQCHSGYLRFKPRGATSQSGRAEKAKEPGKNPMPGLKMTIPN